MAAEGSTQSTGAAGAQWNQAKKCAGKLGYIPSSFNVAVRALVTDQFNNNGTLQPVTKYQVARLLKGPSFKSMLYYATKELKPDSMADKKLWSVGGMMSAFAPLDLASIITCFVFYRKCKKLLGEETWDQVGRDLPQVSLFSGQVGLSIPTIGIGLSLLGNCVQYFASAPFAVEFSKEYGKYAREMKQAGKRFDLPTEESLFGCSNLQIGIYLLSGFGYGTEIGNAYAVACEPDNMPLGQQENLQNRMKAARSWVEVMLHGQDDPGKKVPAKFYPSKEEMVHLKVKAGAIRGGLDSWIDKNKDDIGKDSTPELFAIPAGMEDIPEELRDVFSLEEITSMDEERFDALIDQLDAENDAKSKGGVVLNSKEIAELEEMVTE